MAGSPLVSCINSILTQLSDIKYDWPDGYDIARKAKLFQHVAVWNNQVKREMEGAGYSFAKPAVFVEIAKPITWQQLNLGVNTCDLKLKFHIVALQLDATDGSMDQNLKVFEYRDLFMASMGNGFFPDYCGILSSVSEEHDYEHTNVYHLIVTMNCAFVDTKGADIDPDSGTLIIIDENSGVSPDISGEIVTTLD